VSRLLVFGDLHSDRRHLRGLVERAVEERCDALLSLGDLCYLPRGPIDGLPKRERDLVRSCVP
jgi:predicted phosphodiesterase